MFVGGEGGGDDREAAAKSTATLYANSIHFVFNEVISRRMNGG